VKKVAALVLSDRRLIVRMNASELNLKNTMVHQILTQELATRRLCAKIVPKNLTIEQDNRKDMCLHLLERIQSDRNFLKNVITGNETWILEYDPQTKRQSKVWPTSASHVRKTENEQVKNHIHADLLF